MIPHFVAHARGAELPTVLQSDSRVPRRRTRAAEGVQCVSLRDSRWHRMPLLAHAARGTSSPYCTRSMAGFSCRWNGSVGVRGRQVDPTVAFHDDAQRPADRVPQGGEAGQMRSARTRTSWHRRSLPFRHEAPCGTWTLATVRILSDCNVGVRKSTMVRIASKASYL